MVLCIIALVVFSILSLFSAKYRPLAKESFKCVFKMLTIKPCDTGIDDQLKAQIVSRLLKISPSAARLVNKNFVLFSWILVILTVVSFVYIIYGAYNFYYYGNCNGPGATTACILNDITGDYGRFSNPTELTLPTAFDGLAEGNSSAKVKIIEFGCFTCPYTKEAESTIQTILHEYNGSIYYVFKPFPLPNHKYSKQAAMAVLCASKQGKELELRSSIFAHQDVCSADGTLAIKSLAQTAGLNMTQFSDCYDSNQTLPELNSYINEGKASHIYATPTFFINGKPLVGPKSISEFEQAINDSLKQVNKGG